MMEEELEEDVTVKMILELYKHTDFNGEKWMESYVVSTGDLILGGCHWTVVRGLPHKLKTVTGLTIRFKVLLSRVLLL